MDSKITEIVSRIKPISLDEMDSVKLLNRTDTKFVFAIEKLPEILEDVADEYSVLHVQENPFQAYKTIYYDTLDKKMYHAHQTGRANRYKVRYRTYLSSGDSFMEVKFKNNKGITFKKRIQCAITESEKINTFIEGKTPFCWNELVPTSLVTYTRITLVSLKDAERVTIDVNLEISNYDNGNTSNMEHVCIIELKREKSQSHTCMAQTLKNHRVFENGMSKYSIGTAAVRTDIKLNSFKKKLRFLDKLKKL